LPNYRQAIDEMPQRIRDSSNDVSAYEKAAAAWDAALDSHDAGYHDAPAAWANPNLDASGWAPMNLPTYWEDAGFPALDGFMWFRKVVDVPKEWAGQPLKLGLGSINDMDRAWFNGTLVGRFEQLSGWTKPRVYDVPGELVKAGRNVIAVRVYDLGNKGGICGVAKDIWLKPANLASATALPLAGEWRCKMGLDLATIPRRPPPPDFRADNFRLPGVLFNAMVSPLIPYGVRGAIWYQGESNADRAYQYRDLFPCLIQDWRARWGQGNFPFLYVQLANFLKVNPEPVNDPWAELREAQLMTLRLPKTGMAVTIDIGDADNIHPRNKQEVGRRLSLAARRIAYGEPIGYSGPIYRAMRIEGGAVRLQFDHADGGLVCKGDRLQGFAVAGADQKFYWADASIDGNTVRVSSDKAPNPVAVRYAWSSNPVCNLVNKEGLPASPFRTDNWTGVTEGKH
jgi:sialate O-acetylesterase